MSGRQHPVHLLGATQRQPRLTVQLAPPRGPQRRCLDQKPSSGALRERLSEMSSMQPGGPCSWGFWAAGMESGRQDMRGRGVVIGGAGFPPSPLLMHSWLLAGQGCQDLMEAPGPRPLQPCLLEEPRPAPGRFGGHACRLDG